MPALNRFPRLLYILLLVLIASAFMAKPAFADEGQPPGGTDAPAAADSGDTSSDTGEPQPADASSPDPLPDPVQAAGSAPAPDAAAAQELLDSIPEGVEVVVLDENGGSVPLVTQEAAQIIMDGDPMWCPAGVLPGGAGCTINHPTFAALLADPILAGGGPAMAGVIWVRDNYAGADSAAITINGVTFFNMANFPLTIKGGWTGVGGTINTSTPSVFDVGLTINNWNADVTISDITFNGSTSGGLSVTTTKNITVTRVTATGNTGTGGTFDNDPGTGNVTVTSSKFNSNTNGLAISSQGTITLSNIQANDNAGGYGAYITNEAASTAKNVTMTGANEFNDNKDDGLTIRSKGTITLNDVTANKNGRTDNSGSGAILDNTFGANPGPGVTLNGTNIFNNNDDIGLSVSSYGPIKINNLFANSNDDFDGAYLSNASALTAQPVTLTGSSQFKYNGWAGLYVDSTGVVSLNNITANYNADVGVGIDNTSGSAVVGVNLTGSSAFNENGGDGIFVFSDGAITLSNVTANGNLDYGAYLSSGTLGQKITLTGVNTFNDNSGDGLYITSKGPIIVNSVTASSNGSAGAWMGARLDNTGSGSASPQPVTVTGTNTFDGNRSWGLNIQTYGAVTLSSITAENNGWGTNDGGVLVNNGIADPAKPAAVTFTGTNAFNYNTNDGLSVLSIGAITLSNVTANGNGGGVYGSGFGSGLYLNNAGGVGKGVTLSGVNTFNYNYNNGLYVTSKGAITLSNVTANGNGFGAGAGDGAYLTNGAAGAGTALKVTLSGVNRFDSNYRHGLYIIATGAVTLSNVTASNNGGGASLGDGILVTNLASGSASLQPVTMTGKNDFEYNQSYGVEIYSYGAVSLANLTAISNGSGSLVGGVYIDNSTGVTPASVSISGVNKIAFNKTDGLYIASLGAITLSNVTASNNGSGMAARGAYLNNSGGSANVTILGKNEFTGNYTDGLFILTSGVISLSSVTASYNSHGRGAVLDNSGAATPKSVALSGVNTFTGNYDNGIQIVSLGAVTVNSIASALNGFGASYGYGLYIDNSAGSGNVALTGTNDLSGNYNSGLNVASAGAISISNLTANFNGLPVSGYGAFLDNTLAASAKVAFTGTNTFSGNKSGGLRVLTNGAITSSTALIAESNQGQGIYLDNLAASPAQPVTLSGKVTVNYNYSDGIYVTSLGAITLSNLTADSNGFPSGGYGAYLSNSTSSSPLAGVTLLGTNQANDNYGTGLIIETDGAIKANNLTAGDNGWGGSNGSGALLDNTSPGAAGGVTLTGVNKFVSNYNYGLRVLSTGAITLNSVTASSNNQNQGALLNNTYSGTSTPQNVTLTGANNFSYNPRSTGLDINTYGTVAISNLTANWNGTSSSGYGAFISNSGGTSARNVTLSGTNTFDYNKNSGLFITSLGSIAVSNLTASYNQVGGAQLYNNNGSSTGSVTVSGFGTYTNNTSTGLTIASYGKVTLNKVTASDNGFGGASIVNNSAASPQAVVITGVNAFNNNGGGGGLYLASKGAITLSSITASNNSANGALVTNNFGGAVGGITLTGVNTFLSNALVGLYMQSTGNISVTKSTADGNGGAGVFAYTAAGNVTMTCGSYTNNGGAGIQVDGGTGASVLTLTGIVSAGNLGGDIITTFWTGLPPVIVRNCPLP